MELSTLNLGLGLTISSLVILELCDPYLIPPPQSSDRVRNTLFMQVRNETIQSVQFYSVLSFSIQDFFLSNSFALSGMTA